MKNIKLPLIVLLLLLGTQAQAQLNQTQQMHHRMHQQAMRTIELHRQASESMRIHSMMGNSPKTNAKYKFNFVMLNGDTIFNDKKTKIFFYEPVKEIKIKNKKDEQVYTPANTRSIFVKKGKSHIVGIPHQGHWMFESRRTDSIQFYSPYPEMGLEYISAYRMLGDTIKPVTVSGIEEIVKDNPKALKDAKKNKTVNALHHYFRGLEKRK